MTISEERRSHLAQFIAMLAALTSEEREFVASSLPKVSETLPFLRCPPEWIDKKVSIDYAIPIPGRDGTLNFPGLEGFLLEDGPCHVVLQTRGPNGLEQVSIGKERIQQVRHLVSPIITK